MTEETNPFQSPQSETASSAPKTTEWPFEATELAVVEEIPSPLGEPLSASKSTGRLVSILFLTLFASIFLLPLLALLANWLVGNSNDLFRGIAQYAPLLILFGGPLLVLLLTQGRYLYLGEVGPYRHLKHLIKKRPANHMPSLNSPNCQLVAIVPRERWSLTEKQSVEEFAILFIDPYESRIVVEGSQHRIWVPSDSILNCVLDHFSQKDQLTWIVSLTVRTKSGAHEICLKIGNIELFRQTNSQRKADAEKYWNRIMMLKRAPLKSAKTT